MLSKHRAVRWFRLVTDAGTNATPGVPQDNVEAYKWFNLATVYADASEQEGLAEVRDDVAVRLTPQQRADGQKLSREWFAAHPREP